MFETEHPSGLSQWRRVYELLVGKEIGELVTYAELEQVVPGIMRTRSAYHRALKELETQNSRSLRNVRGEGYIVIHPREHLGEMLRYDKRATTAVKTGRRKGTAADRKLLARPDAKRIDDLEQQMATVQSALEKMQRSEAARKAAETKASRKRTDISPAVLQPPAEPPQTAAS